MTTILVGTNLGPAADEAVRQAHQLASARGARLIVVHVLERVMPMNLLFPQLNLQAATELPAQVALAVEAVAARVLALTGRARDEYQLLVEEGAAEEVIVRHAEHTAADLIVIGSSSGGLMRRLFGNVAERVVRYAHGPVLVARPAPKRGRVLVATDFSDPSLPAVEAATVEARARGAELHIVHGVNATVGLPVSHGLGAPAFELGVETLTRVRAAAEERMREALRRFGMHGTTHLIDGATGVAIVQLANQLEPELIVLGTIGNTGLKRLALGSVAEYVVSEAAQPTLVVRLAHSAGEPARHAVQ